MITSKIEPTETNAAQFTTSLSTSTSTSTSTSLVFTILAAVVATTTNTTIATTVGATSTIAVGHSLPVDLMVGAVPLCLPPRHCDGFADPLVGHFTTPPQ